MTGDTLVATDSGLYNVLDLRQKFSPLVDGKACQSSGFWKTGFKPIYNIELDSGRIVKATSNHQIMTDNGWIEAKDLKPNDNLVIHNHRNHNQKSYMSPNSDYAKGYLFGGFIGDGNVSENSAELKWSWDRDWETNNL